MKPTTPPELLLAPGQLEFVIALDDKHMVIPPNREAVDLIKSVANIDATPVFAQGLQSAPPFFIKFHGSHDDLINIKWEMRKKGFRILRYFIYIAFEGMIKARYSINPKILQSRLHISY